MLLRGKRYIYQESLFRVQRIVIVRNNMKQHESYDIRNNMNNIQSKIRDIPCQTTYNKNKPRIVSEWLRITICFLWIIKNQQLQ